MLDASSSSFSVAHLKSLLEICIYIVVTNENKQHTQKSDLHTVSCFGVACGVMVCKSPKNMPPLWFGHDLFYKHWLLWILINL